MPKRYFKRSRKKRPRPTPRQENFIKGVAAGKTMTQAAIDAGYSPENANQSGYQAMNALRGRMPQLLERHGIGEDVLIGKYLLPLLDAHETKFFPQGITMQVKTVTKKGKERIVDKLVYTVDVQSLGIRHAALRTAFELHGSYAPRDPKEAAQFGVKIIKIDVPRPPDSFNQFQEFVDVIPENALTSHGSKPVNSTNGAPKNGNKPPTNEDES
jgi:hypothetical protein